MIHAHHFYFADQPSLQKEYESFNFEVKENRDDNTIVVKEINQHKGFCTRSTVRYLSGRECTYLSDKPFELLGKNDNWGLEVQDLLTLVWDSTSRSIVYGRGRLFTSELLRFWILHTFLPIVLEIEKTYRVLHVGAVEVEGGPVLFSAASFGGKSTLTDYFLKKGHALYSDDTLAVRKENGQYIAYPSFPYHRPYRQPETLGKRAENFSRNPMPIKAIYELERVASDLSVEITPSKGVEKFKTLYYSNFTNFRFMKKERFAFAMEMAKHVPVYRIMVPHDLDRLEEVYEAIVKKTREL